MKCLTIIISLLVVCFSSALLAGEKKTANPAALVNSVVIAQKEVEEAVAVLIPQASYHRGVTPEKKRELQKQALDNLIQEELFYRAGLKKGYRVPKADLNKKFEEIAKKYRTKNMFKEALSKYDLTEEELKKKIERIMLADLFVNEEVYKKAMLKEGELFEYYQINKANFQKPEAVRLSHILIKIPPEALQEEKETLKKKAADIYQRLVKGESFEELAWNNSDDASRVKGGDLGVVHRGRLEPELEEPVFSLQKGEMSGIVASLYGFHIFKAIDKIPSQQLTFEEVKDKLRRELENKEIQGRLTQLVKLLKENAKIEIFTN
jgi:parvulin-like peptidyl-prolyl isomerase